MALLLLLLAGIGVVTLFTGCVRLFSEQLEKDPGYRAHKIKYTRNEL